jgi:hypothetical protein
MYPALKYVLDTSVFAKGNMVSFLPPQKKKTVSSPLVQALTSISELLVVEPNLEYK